MKKTAIIFLLSVVLGVMFSSGCAGTTKIGDILANPDTYQGREVAIDGTIETNLWVALLGKGAYKVNDGSGSIWVVTNHTPPEKGKSLRVKGMVERAFTFGGQSLGTVIIETSRD